MDAKSTTMSNRSTTRPAAPSATPWASGCREHSSRNRSFDPSAAVAGRIAPAGRRRISADPLRRSTEHNHLPKNGLRLAAAPVTRPHALHHRHLRPDRRAASDRPQHGADRARRPRRLCRPQRRRQIDAVSRHPRRTSDRDRHHLAPAALADRQPGAGSSRRPGKPDRGRAQGRSRARRAAARSRDRSTIRTGSPKSRPALSISTRIQHRRAQPQSCPASAFRPPTSRAPARNSPAAGACAWRWPQRCLRRPICCCWTSPPTISTSKARCGSRIIWRTIRAP